jgi:monoamine oxidase
VFANQYSRNLSASRFMNWPGETFTGTGYSCPGLNQITTVGAALNSAFSDRMFFAGEHCCFRFFGFMEGALQSGLDAATRVGQRSAAGP